LPFPFPFPLLLPPELPLATATELIAAMIEAARINFFMCESFREGLREFTS
jgi:hypothetical protein